MKYLPPLPEDIAGGLERFQRDHPNTWRTAFIMMPFGRNPLYDEVVTTIRQTCASFTVDAVRADDCHYVDDLFANVTVCMHGCGVGIAVFDQIAPTVFNPNVALEVGCMRALGRRVCLLKDSRITSLPADLIGRLYRPFDATRVTTTLAHSLRGWLHDNDFDAMLPNLDDPLTAASFKAYMRWRFPHEELFDGDGHFERHWRALFTYGFILCCAT